MSQVRKRSKSSSQNPAGAIDLRERMLSDEGGVTRGRDAVNDTNVTRRAPSFLIVSLRRRRHYHTRFAIIRNFELEAKASPFDSRD